jgi:hypothetical protein
VEKQYRVQGCFHHDYTEEVTERHVRAYKGKPAHTERQVRYQLTVSRNQVAIQAAEFEAGWRIYATNEAAERLSLGQTVEVYRDQIIQENIFRPSACSRRLTGSTWSFSRQRPTAQPF